MYILRVFLSVWSNIPRVYYTCTCTCMSLWTFVSVQAITLLNNAGVCVSYQRAWEYLRLLTNEAEYLKVVRTGHWQWVYDNINVHQKVRHKRSGIHIHMQYAGKYTCYTTTLSQDTVHTYVCTLTTDKHSTMLNMTARLAVEIRNLPDWEIDWEDTTPQ